MKTKITFKELKREYVVAIPYSKSFDLFEGFKPLYYNAGVYGWNCDVWYSPYYGIYFISGYRYPKTIVNEYWYNIGLDGVDYKRLIAEKYL